MSTVLWLLVISALSGMFFVALTLAKERIDQLHRRAIRAERRAFDSMTKERCLYEIVRGHRDTASALRGVVAKLQGRLPYPRSRQIDELNLYSRWDFCDLDFAEYTAMIHKNLIAKWRKERTEGNWGKYLAREREIREGVTK